MSGAPRGPAALVSQLLGRVRAELLVLGGLGWGFAGYAAAGPTVILWLTSSSRVIRRLVSR
jgi:hypothetical protein